MRDLVLNTTVILVLRASNEEIRFRYTASWVGPNQVKQNFILNTYMTFIYG